jgi:hypothetical protein
VHETFRRGGQVGRDLMAVDWTATPLGPPDTWPRSLRAALRIVLGSRFPMWMAWGPELTFFCNDAYRRDTLGGKYPWALGRPAPVVWSEVWSDVEDRVDRVLHQGEATWDEKLQLFLQRDGYREETFHTFSYSPVVDDNGAIAGLLCVVSEETREVLRQRRMGVLRELGDRIHSPRAESELLEIVSSSLDDGWPDVPFHLLYLWAEDGLPRLVGQGGFKDELPEVSWPDPTLSAELTVVPEVAALFDEVPVGPWQVPATQAAVVPVAGPLRESYGFLVAGLNPFRRPDEEYADFVTALGARIGTAIAGVRAAAELAAREHEIADELQSSLLPEITIDRADLDVTTYYRAGVQGTQVGGDWYDVIGLDGGRTALVVGDVMGRGVRAASVMGQLRTAIRAYARLGLPPDQLLASLDGLVRDLFPEQVVTCLYAVFDPADCSLSFVSAGHLPLLVVSSDGCERIDVESHPPLGVGVPFHRVHRVGLRPGNGVLLYTDGLVERRGSDLETGIESLRRLLATAEGPLDGIPAWLARTLLPLGPADDVAVLLARVGGNRP